MKHKIEIDEQLDREMQRKARRKARIDHGGNPPTGTKAHKNKKNYKRKEKHGGSLKYAV